MEEKMNKNYDAAKRDIERSKCCYTIARMEWTIHRVRGVGRSWENENDEAEIRIIMRTEIAYRIHTSENDSIKSVQTKSTYNV